MNLASTPFSISQSAMFCTPKISELFNGQVVIQKLYNTMQKCKYYSTFVYSFC